MKYFVTLGENTVEVVVDGDVVTVDGRRVEARLEGVPGTPEVRLLVDGMATSLAVESHDGSGLRLVDRGAVRDLTVEDERSRHIRLLAGAGKAVDGHSVLKAPMPGLVLRILVAVGDRVTAGMPLLALEAMKMENELRATAPGVVSAVRVVQGDAVQKGQLLLEVSAG
jgi:acetyl/propionyl-CoA carboxylase alpha subunit